MSFFDKFRKKKTSADDEILDHAPVVYPGESVHQDDNAEENRYVGGLSDPSEGQTYSPTKNTKGILMFILMLVGVVALTGYFGWDLFNSFGLFSSSGIKQSGKTPKLDVTEEQVLKLLEERKQMLDKLQTFEDERSRQSQETDQKIASVMKEFKKYEAMEQAFSGVRDEAKQLAEQNRQLNENMNKLMEEIRKQGPKEPPEPIVPRQGSASKSMSFSGVKGYVDRVQTREDELKKEAQKEPLYTDVPGVQVGQAIRGVLLTTLVSSKALEHYFAAIETTEPVEVYEGLILPKGVKFLGKAEADYDSRRIFVNITRMQYGTIDMPVNGVVLDGRGSAGLVTKYIDPLNNAAWSMLIPNLLAATADVAQDMVKYYDNEGNLNEKPEFSAKNVALQGFGNTMQLQSQMMFEAQARKKPVIIVKSGIPVSIQLRDRIPVDILLDSGVIRDR